MNLLVKIKACNYYNYTTNSLYEEDGETPITCIDGETALLLTDGTSWEMSDGEWVQIEKNEDFIILNSFYPFITSVCNSINEHFCINQFSAIYENVEIEKDEENNVIVVSQLSEEPKVVVNDYVILKCYVKKYVTGDTVLWNNSWNNFSNRMLDLHGIKLPEYPIEEFNSYLTSVKSLDESSITLDASSVDLRLTGTDEIIGVFMVSFPPEFLNAVFGMFCYDLFQREDKEKRQERLGNYTYTNFEPVQYYGEKSYPSKYTSVISYFGDFSL